MSELNGGMHEGENRRRLDQMEDVTQSVITLTLELGKLSTLRHEETMTEIRELITQQKSTEWISWRYLSCKSGVRADERYVGLGAPRKKVVPHCKCGR